MQYGSEMFGFEIIEHLADEEIVYVRERRLRDRLAACAETLRASRI
jgi:hypothetical protein